MEEAFNFDFAYVVKGMTISNKDEHKNMQGSFNWLFIVTLLSPDESEAV